MPNKTNLKPELSNPNYVPVIKNSDTFYGGSQMWFPNDHFFSREYILHNYGCGTIATADLFLYLSLKSNQFRSLETEIAFRGSNHIYAENYEAYVRTINSHYTKTKRYIAVLGTKIASVINNYSDSYGFGYQASWKISLTYYDMLEIMEEMLSQDIPVILSIGPNTPMLWGKKGIPFYTIREIDFSEADIKNLGEKYSAKNSITADVKQPEAAEKPSGDPQSPQQPFESQPAPGNQQPPDNQPNSDNPSSFDIQKFILAKIPAIKKPYYYKVAAPSVHGHFVTVTGVIKDDVANRIMLRISSWGKQYYINYEEYRDYIDSFSDTITSSIVRIRKGN